MNLRSFCRYRSIKKERFVPVNKKLILSGMLVALFCILLFGSSALAHTKGALLGHRSAPSGMHLVYHDKGSDTAKTTETFQLNGNSVLAFACSSQNGGDFGVLAYDASRYDTQISQVMTSQCNPSGSNQEQFYFKGPADLSITADSFGGNIQWEVAVWTQD
jgi:hypothetical protein